MTVAGLQVRVEEARACGYAWAPMGVVPNTSAVAVPVLDERGTPLAAVTVAAMADRLSERRLATAVGALRDTARRIARRRAQLEGARAR
jgi:DNA-binding IclR family transcriptional regulator